MSIAQGSRPPESVSKPCPNCVVQGVWQLDGVTGAAVARHHVHWTTVWVLIRRHGGSGLVGSRAAAREMGVVGVGRQAGMVRVRMKGAAQKKGTGVTRGSAMLLIPAVPVDGAGGSRGRGCL